MINYYLCYFDSFQYKQQTGWVDIIMISSQPSEPIDRKEQEAVICNHPCTGSGVCCGPCNPSKWEADI